MTDLTRPDFRTTFHGYDRGQVQKLVDRIERTLAGTARLDPVTVPDLQYDVYFDVRVGGYDRKEVQQYLAEAIATLRRRAVAA